MLRNILRVLSAGLAANGAFMVWVARYGTLWQYETDLGWFAPYVLRPGMYAIGSFSVVMGLWYAWLAYTTCGRVLAQWVDDIRHDVGSGAVGDLGLAEVVRLYARELWYRRGCLIGQHGLENLIYFPGEGTVCENCGLPVALRLSWSDRFWLWINREDKVQAKWTASIDRILPPIEAGLTQMMIQSRAAEKDRLEIHERLLAAGAKWDGQDGYDMTFAPWPDDEPSILVLHPDGQHRLEGAPDDGCFTQGSDAVVRHSRCDKEC